MSFGDDLAAALGDLRAAAETRMRGACTIDRPLTTNPPVLDDDGNVIQQTQSVYVGRCYTRYPGLAFETNADSQGVSVVQSKLVVRIPFGAVIRPGDVVTITDDPDNSQLVGTRLRVASIDDQSQATAQRLICDDYQAGVA